MQWCHLYDSHGFIKPIKSAFIYKSITKFLCPISLINNITKTNTKIQINKAPNKSAKFKLIQIKCEFESI